MSLLAFVYVHNCRYKLIFIDSCGNLLSAYQHITCGPKNILVDILCAQSIRFGKQYRNLFDDELP